MTWFEALILGIIQGLTEFLPISSSGHLELGKFLLGGSEIPEESLLFTVIVHGATALSTIVVFRKDISEIFAGLFKFNNNEEFKFSVKIIISMFPAVFVGLVFEDFIENLFSGNILLVSAMLILTGLLLFLADKAKNTEKSVSYLHALIIGVSQAIAILPGISRSGATISTSVLLGIDRSKAARFSFLMVVPLIIGKISKDLLDGTLMAQEDSFLILGIGFVAAFIAGLFACTWMIALVKRSKLKYFAFYCFIVGGIFLIFQLL
ncbi:undecaprenyl-diphosphate phosphatase [Hyphobacterium sp. CCMP332]|nr:undecaprenyl-diphosphate phosphatase [Hyphobacterium sp. CCMP332]